MAFNKTKLQNDLHSVFTSMGENATEDDFANGISEAVRDFVKTGQVVTTDGGTVSGGVFVGSGSESLSSNSTIKSTACASIIKSACIQMKTMQSGADNYLAEEIGKGIKKMSTDIMITTSVTGTLTPPSPASPITPYPPSGGTAKGSISCSESSLVSGLKSVFSQMWQNRTDTSYDGNLELAKKLADEVYSFWKSGVISTSGQAVLQGSSGAGTVS